MTGLVTWAVAHARMIVALMIITVAAGAFAYVSLPREGSPNIDIPVLYVSVSLPGVSASDSERLLVKPLEAKLRGLEGMKDMTSVASEGHAGILLEFDLGWNKTQRIADVRARADDARTEMPADALPPSITEVNLSAFPILVVSLSGDAPERTMQRVAKDMQREIEALQPVLEVGLAGYREEMVEVLVDPLLLEAYNITAQELLRVVSNNNRLVAAGAVQSDAGRFSVRLPGNFEGAEQIYATPIRAIGDRVVTIADVATIRRTFEDATGTARFNGAPTIALQIKKRLGENIIDTVRLVKDRVREIEASWPAPLRASIEVNFSMDESQKVLGMVGQLESSVLTAVALVIVVVVLTLGARSAVLVGLSIPASFLLSFALIAAFGMSINNMVMFGLILAVGMLVDGAIVVSEYADRRIAEGASPDVAYADAARRMFWPIVSSTATTLCAFLPMLFWPGLPGKFMSNLPVTLIFVLSGSLIVALIFLPVLGGAIARAGAFAGGALRGLRLLRPRARPTVDAARRRTKLGRFVSFYVSNPVGPFVVIALTAAGLFAITSYYQSHNNGVEFFVKTEPERAILYVRARGNLSLAEKDRLVGDVERRIEGVEGIGAIFSFAGSGGLQREGGEGPKDAIGQIQIELAPWGARPPGADVLAEVARRAAEAPGVIAELSTQKDGPQQGKPIQLRLESRDWDKLLAAAAATSERFRSIDGLQDIEDTRPLPGIDWQINVDREAAGRFGADIQMIGVLVQLVTRGALLDTFRPDDSQEEIDIRVRFPAPDRVLSTLDTLKLRTPNGLVPLGNFISIRPVPALAEISRFDGLRYVLVQAGVAPGVNVNDKIAEIKASFDAAPIPGVSAELQGDQEEQTKSQKFLVSAFAAALGLMFAILLAQFNSLFNAVLVLSAVVLSTVGVMIGMLVMDQTFSIIMTGTGIVALAGIVVNNNIVLIDTFREFSETMPRLEAIVRTVEQRIRPVMLTTVTTMAGLAPMMFAASVDFGAFGRGFAALMAAGPLTAAGWRAFFGDVISLGAPTALWWTQLSTAVVFGLGIATLLTLIVTPASLAARVWIGRLLATMGVQARLALFARVSRSLARDVRLRRRARRTAPGEIIWDAGDRGTAAPAIPVLPRPYIDAAE
jgi:multidrug efflux pump